MHYSRIICYIILKIYLRYNNSVEFQIRTFKQTFLKGKKKHLNQL